MSGHDFSRAENVLQMIPGLCPLRNTTTQEMWVPHVPIF